MSLQNRSLGLWFRKDNHSTEVMSSKKFDVTQESTIKKIARFLNEVHIPEFDVFSIGGSYIKTIQLMWREKNGLLYCELPSELWPTMRADDIRQAPLKFSQKAKDAGFSEDLINTFSEKLEFKIERRGIDMFDNEIYFVYHVLKDQIFLNVLLELAEKQNRNICEERFLRRSNPDVPGSSWPNTSQLREGDFLFSGVRGIEVIEEEYEIIAPGGPGFSHL